MARYGQKFKDAVVARLLPPESSSLEAVSQKGGISVATLERSRAVTLAGSEGNGSPWAWRCHDPAPACVTSPHFSH